MPTPQESEQKKLDHITFFIKIRTDTMARKTTTKSVIAEVLTQDTTAEITFSFSALIKQGYDVSKGINGADNKLTSWLYNVVSTPLTGDELKILNTDVKSWYSASFSKQVNGAVNTAYKLGVINDKERLLNLSLKTSFNELYKQLREWKSGGKDTAQTTAKNKGKNSTKEQADESAGDILAQCSHATDRGFSDVSTTLILFGKLINDLQGELTAEQNAHIITVLDELSSYVLKGE
jgi:hypothetical protein